MIHAAEVREFLAENRDYDWRDLVAVAVGATIQRMPTIQTGCWRCGDDQA